REKTRTQVGLLLEAGDVREVHHVALLVGYGAAAVNPYLAMESVEDLARQGYFVKADPEQAVANLIKGLGKGVLKVMSKIDVYPVIDDRIKIDIDESQVRVDTMRSGGAGGQHVNKTESAVRLTHIPTGIAVVSQGDRSQHKNRATAWNMLRAKLYEMELKKREAQAAADQAAKTDIGWGHQIRSYVLQPYQMVKDLRTGVTSSDPQGVLDGDLDQYMEAALAQRVYGGGPESVEDVD
ncbi:MAG TPA: peptide chain release factor-like protein, partial [Sphingomicrobium sp.]|nr:peptide chain release factor-like protein [Sphingomicrobium sp.]